MPQISITLPETHMSISRPVTLSVMRDLDRLMRLGIAENEIPIQFLGRGDIQFKLNSDVTRGDINAQSDIIRTDSTRKMSINIIEEYDETSMLTTKTFGGNTSRHIFNDPNLSISMRPVYSPTKVSIEVMYRTADLREAEAWRDEQRLKIARDRADLVHSAEYIYPIPKEYVVILHELFKVREKQAGYGDTFKQYFDKYRSDKFTVQTTQAGTEPLLAIGENQLNIMGYFDFTDLPVESKESNRPGWSIGFRYVFNYDKVINVVMQYPLVVHNRLIPSKLRDSTDDTMYSRMVADRALTTHWMDYMRSLNLQWYGNIPGVRIPYYDEWWINETHRYLVPVVTMLCGVLPNNLTEINSIVNFEYFTLDSKYIPYITKYRHRLLEPYFSPLQYTVYCGDTKLNNSDFYIDDQLILRSKKDLNLRLTYHLRLSILTDLKLLSKDGADAIGEYPPAAQDTIDFVVPGEKVKTIVGGKLVNRDDWIRVINKNQPNKYMLRNVGHFLITTTEN